MGRQIALCTTDEDNMLFQNYLNDNFNCAFFQSFASSAEKLWLSSFDQFADPPCTIKIWNKDFDWHPIYSTTSTKEKLSYISNTSNAPIIELAKTQWTPDRIRTGRIYWSKYFMGSPDYDVAPFEKFYNKVENWFKKNAVGKEKYGGLNTYYLKHAWDRHKQLLLKDS
jgi:hypothetical protein